MAILSSSTNVEPSFAPDRSGTYGATLMVNDGKINSVAANVSILVETPLAGMLSTSKELTVVGSPYILTATLSIPRGLTLTIDRGIQIDGGGNPIVVEGALTGNGTVAVPLPLNSVNIQPAGKVDPALRHQIALTGVVMKQGSMYAPTGNAIYGSLSLLDSQFIDLTSYLYIWYPLADTVIERNVFLRSGGISYCADFRPRSGPDIATSVSIKNNYFQSWTNGFAIENWVCHGV